MDESSFSDEDKIQAVVLIQTLLEQRKTRLKGGLYHLTQIGLAYNSNRIEGSQLTEEQTRFIYETNTIEGIAPVDDVIETVNHFGLFDYMLDKSDEPLSTDRIKNYHKILKTGTSAAQLDWFKVGDWKQLKNGVGNMETTAPAKVDKEMRALLGNYPDKKTMSFYDICDFHHRFECIHPFQDGNGRIGGIIMFEQCIKSNIMPFIVLHSKKSFYYRGLANYKNEPGYLRDTFRSFQDQYFARFRDYIPL